MKSKTKHSIRNLISAARKGDLPKIHECLAAGVDVNAVFLLHGIICECALGAAAAENQVEAIKVLLKHGANPNPIFPINQLHQIHPLQWAADLGRSTEAVRLLLEAGADVNRVDKDGQTILDSPFVQNNQPMIDLLKKFRGKTGGSLGTTAASKPRLWESRPSHNEWEQAELDLTAEADTPEFSKFVNQISRASRVPIQAVKNAAGACAFNLSKKRADKLLESYFQPALAEGFFLFRATTSESEGIHRLVLLPTSDRYVALIVMQTNGANSDLMPEDIIQWLKKLEARHPFEIDGIGYDFLEGRFHPPIKKPKELADELYEFCPDIVDQGTGTVQRLANELKRTGKLFLWWD